MNVSSFRSKIQIAAVIAATLAGTSAFAAPGTMRIEFEKAKTEKDISAKTVEKLDVIATQMKVSRSVVFDFFKEETKNMTEASEAAWSTLLNRIQVKSRTQTTPEDFMSVESNAQIVSAYISARESKMVENLPFSEVDLAELTKTWDLKQKQNFAKVMKRTSEIASTNGGAPTLRDAFEAAMKELGFLDEYRKGCK